MGNKKELLNYIKTVGKDQTWRQLANKFGYTSEDTVRKIVKRNLSHYTETTTITNISSDSTTSEESNETSYDFNKGEMKISHIWDHPPTPEEIIEHHNIDESKWKLSNVWVKMKKGGYQTSALFSQKKSKDVTPDDIKRVLDNFTPPKLSLDSGSKINKKYSSPCSAFIDITDFHLDKKTLDGDTIEDRIENYYDIVRTLLYRCYNSFYLDEIVFVIGSDWFHTDTFQGTTTKGTEQDVIVSWDKAFTIGFDLYVKTIQILSKFCDNLKIVLVSGNHDRTKGFYVSYALERYFENVQNITFDISPDMRKVHSYGNTFIGLHHGNCKLNDLPLLFAKEFSKEWGGCKYHEVKTGDKHFYMEKEIKGVRVKQLPSLSGADQWHNDNNFVQNIRAGIVTVYDKEKGKVAEYEERL